MNQLIEEEETLDTFNISVLRNCQLYVKSLKELKEISEEHLDTLMLKRKIELKKSIDAVVTLTNSEKIVMLEKVMTKKEKQTVISTCNLILLII